jgi:acetyltransferase-like isoleucine patch superfamily enzyme
LNTLRNIRNWLRWFLVFHKQVWLGLILRSKGIFCGYHIESDFRITTLQNVSIGTGVVVQRRSVFGLKPGATLRIGKGSRIGSDCVLAVQEKMELGDNVLIAARCFITDHNHEFRDRDRPVMGQGATPPKPISIGDNCWFGINVCILPGVKLGRNCVVGANSVVTRSFPDYSILVGTPAKAVSTAASGLPEDRP